MGNKCFCPAKEGHSPISVIAETGLLGGGGQPQDATSGVNRKQAREGA
eukprot:CAMPEP_0180410642 /NCGR_PEP_ID=MMETSP0989-20121125/43533_1 /TAXON_ID=697907 /ORGANISM="non described non described, Strain CCMP2293" /LENGTH=47 /DNA_ID= /DNA_START= /DNA_END= /DNA_ORIENTATION=